MLPRRPHNLGLTLMSNCQYTQCSAKLQNSRRSSQPPTAKHCCQYVACCCLQNLCAALQYIAQPNIVPIAAIVSEPSPGCNLIELDTVYVLAFNKYWFAPITWLLPDESVSNVHMKIGVDGSLESGKVSR